MQQRFQSGVGVEAVSPRPGFQSAPASESASPWAGARWSGYAVAAAGVAATTVALFWIAHHARIANVSALYLLVIMVVAAGYGTAPAVFASGLAFVAFDWFFVEPLHHWTVDDPGEWVALMTFLVAGLITGQLAGRLRAREAEAQRRAEETAALAHVSQSIAAHVEEQAVLDEVVRRLGDVAPIAAAAILRPNEGQVWELVARSTPSAPLPDFRERAGELTRACRDRSVAIDEEGRPAPGKVEADLEARELDAAPLAKGGSLEAFLPLAAQGHTVGVLYLLPRAPLSAHERGLVESLANHAAVALAREQLTRAAARAAALEEADRLRNALLSMVTHDFRSPLASIKASVTGLMEDDAGWDPAVRRELLAGIDQETNRLSRLVADVLDMSRLEAGAWRPEPGPCAVADLIGVALRSLTPEQDARVRVRLPEELPLISVDLAQMERVLWNLLDNALKYSEGPVDITASAAGGVLKLSVADCGPGLEPGEEAWVFEKFYRSPRFRESSVPGSGLGLSVCRSIVESHAGGLSVRNRLGGGAAFTIELPCDACPGH